MKILILPFVALAVVSALVAAQAQQPNARRPNHAEHQMKLTGDMSKDMRSMNAMMVEKLGKADREYEKRFIDLMIPHHEGAILMAEDALKKATRPEIKEMARKMIEDQQREITKLKKLRDEWFTGRDDKTK